MFIVGLCLSFYLLFHQLTNKNQNIKLNRFVGRYGNYYFMIIWVQYLISCVTFSASLPRWGQEDSVIAYDYDMTCRPPKNSFTHKRTSPDGRQHLQRSVVKKRVLFNIF